MINRWSIAAAAILLSLGLIWVGRQLRKVVNQTSSFETFLPSNMPKSFSFPPEAVMTNLEIRGRKVKGEIPPVSADGNRKLVLTNRVSPQWKAGLERSLLAQGGQTLKDIKISKLDSFIWSVGGQAVNVESVLIILENEKGELTRFNAMVDSESGKIIQTWNQPVIDPMNPRESEGVRIDPRYLQN